MPDHIRFILRHAAIGFGLAVAFVGMLCAFNVAGLWHLVTHTAEGPIALAVLVVLCGITFGSAQVGYKIMTLGDDHDDDDDTTGRRDAIFARDAIPVPVRIRTDDRRR
mgnify:CR=1 FL=1|jgi:hypothetical protein